jgi:hypothetical protein
VNKRERALWQQMADMTLARCLKVCKTGLGSCCSESCCEMALETMRNSGEKPPKKARGEDGKCLVPPHHRPLCALHQCDICSLGFAADDLDWTERYFALRAKLTEER